MTTKKAPKRKISKNERDFAKVIIMLDHLDVFESNIVPDLTSAMDMSNEDLYKIVNRAWKLQN